MLTVETFAISIEVTPVNTRSSVRAVVFLTAACLLLDLCSAPPRAQAPPDKPLTAEQREKLKERDRLIAKVDSLKWWAELHERLENFEAARKARKEVVDIATRLYGRENWRATDARLALTNLELRAKLTPEQRQRLREAMVDYRRVLALYRQGKYGEAVPLAERSAEQWKLLMGEKHPDYATDLNNLAGLYKAMGDYAKAESLYRQARDILKAALGENHPSYTVSLNNLAELYRLMGDYAKAEPLFRRALDIAKEAPGENHPHYATCLNNLAELYRLMGDYAKAESLFRRAGDIDKQALGEKHPDYATDLNNLAALYDDMGDYAKAEPLYRQARDIYKQALGDKHPDYATSLNNLAMLYLAKNEGAQSQKLTRQALQIRRAQLDLTANVQSERQQLRMNERSRGDFDKFLTAASAAKESADAVYADVLTWKGAVSAAAADAAFATRAGQQQPRNRPSLCRPRSRGSATGDPHQHHARPQAS
jgi:tetratricopeptide (TPR) repeat protein